LLVPLGALSVLGYLITGGDAQSVPPIVAPSTSHSVTVTIRNFNFDPPIVAIGPGQTGVWVNKDGTTHTIMSDSNA
jgi:plastocyanin